MNNIEVLQRFFSIIGDQKDILYTYLKKEKRQKIDDLVKNPILPNSSVELEEILEFMVSKQEAFSKQDKNDDSLSQEKQDETNKKDEKPVVLDKYARAAKRLSEQPTQLIAFFLENCNDELSEKLKEHLEEKLLAEIEETFVKSLPFEEETVLCIEDEIFKEDEDVSSE